MRRNFDDTVAARHAGQVPGFRGHDETLEDFERRHQAELDGKVPGVPGLYETPQDFAARVNRELARATSSDEPAPAKAAAKKAAAKRR